MVGGLLVAVATITALYTISGLMNEDFQRRLDEYGTNMVITPKSDSLPLTYGGVAMGSVGLAQRSLTDADVSKLKTIKNAESLAVISPKIIGVTRVGKKEAMVVGVRFADELRIKKWWEVDAGKRPRPGANQALAGAAAAEAFDLKPGSRVRIGGERFTISGILEEVGSEEDKPIYIGLKKAQTLFGRPGELDIIEVAAWCYNCPIEMIAGQTTEKLPHAKASAVLQAAKTRGQVVAQFNMFSIILSATVAMVGGLIVFSSMLASVRERRREIGIFRAVGFRSLNVLEIVLFETVVLGLLGGVGGYFLGLAATIVAAPALGLTGSVAIDPAVGYLAVLGTMMLTLTAGLYPALTAARLSPMIALNDI